VKTHTQYHTPQECTSQTAVHTSKHANMQIVAPNTRAINSINT